MPTISKQQPMRPAEIDLADQVNTNTGDIETNNQCSMIVYNLTNTDVTGVTVSYLAISGR